MTQMTPGSMSVVPQNSVERAFNVACLLIGLFVGALLVSQLSARMVKLQLENNEAMSRMAKLRRFLMENNISWQLRTRVQHQISEGLAVHKRLTEKDVPLLKSLSTSLRREICYSSFAHLIMTHTVFHTWGLVELNLIPAMCAKAAELLCLSKDDDLFTPLSAADNMYFVISGILQYSGEDLMSRIPSAKNSIQSASTAMGNSRSEEDPGGTLVHKGEWVSEVSLWMEWTYKGSLQAVTECELLSLHVPTVLQILQKNLRVQRLNYHFCAAFQEQVMDEMATVTQEPHEIAVDHELVLMSMPLEPRFQVMQPLLDSISSGTVMGFTRPRFVEKGPEELRNELEAGKCIISLGANGRVQRTVLLVALRLKRSEGQLLVRLAKVKDGMFLPACGMPGTKLKQAERPVQALRRLMSTELEPFKEAIHVTHQYKTQEMGNSAAYGIPTKYHKTVFMATLKTENGNNAGAASSAESASNQSEVSEKSVHEGHKMRRLMIHRTSIASALSSQGSHKNIEESLDNIETFIISTPGNDELYGWVHSSDFQAMKSPEGGEELKAWLNKKNKPVASRSVSSLAPGGV